MDCPRRVLDILFYADNVHHHFSVMRGEDSWDLWVVLRNVSHAWRSHARRWFQDRLCPDDGSTDTNLCLCNTVNGISNISDIQSLIVNERGMVERQRIATLTSLFQGVTKLTHLKLVSDFNGNYFSYDWNIVTWFSIEEMLKELSSKVRISNLSISSGDDSVSDFEPHESLSELSYLSWSEFGHPEPEQNGRVSSALEWMLSLPTMRRASLSWSGVLQLPAVDLDELKIHCKENIDCNLRVPHPVNRIDRLIFIFTHAVVDSNFCRFMVLERTIVNILSIANIQIDKVKELEVTFRDPSVDYPLRPTFCLRGFVCQNTKLRLTGFRVKPSMYVVKSLELFECELC
jgi:hypothetical protein